MDINVINVLFSDKMKQGKILAKRLIELYEKIALLRHVLDEGTATPPLQLDEVRKLMCEEPTQSSVEGWAERIKMYFQTLLSPVDEMLKLVDSITILLREKKTESTENGSQPLTKADLIDMWNAEVLQFEKQQKIKRFQGEPLIVFESFKEKPAEYLLRIDYELQRSSSNIKLLTDKLSNNAQKDYAEAIAKMVVDKTTGRLATKISNQVAEKVNDVIQTQLSDKRNVIINGQMLHHPIDKGKTPVPRKKRWWLMCLKEPGFLYATITLLLMIAIFIVFANAV
ncbi:hypothetical protein [Hallella multisaccharivorax]|uniref:hypothetical protein n=1 Tax=Hallella multisaccharivorax TaxID=310514 RepID=UPI0036108EAB